MNGVIFTSLDMITIIAWSGNILNWRRAAWIRLLRMIQQRSDGCVSLQLQQYSVTCSGVKSKKLHNINLLFQYESAGGYVPHPEAVFPTCFPHLTLLYSATQPSFVSQNNLTAAILSNLVTTTISSSSAAIHYSPSKNEAINRRPPRNRTWAALSTGNTAANTANVCKKDGFAKGLIEACYLWLMKAKRIRKSGPLCQRCNYLFE